MIARRRRRDGPPPYNVAANIESVPAVVQGCLDGPAVIDLPVELTTPVCGGAEVS
jgi:hypothetical protein